MKKWKMSLIGSIALIPAISIVVSCSASNNGDQIKIKVAEAKQYMLDYYNNLTIISPGSAESLMNFENNKYISLGISAVDSITTGSLNGTNQEFKVIVSPETIVENIPKISFTNEIDLNTHIISYTQFKPTTFVNLGSPYDSGGDVILVNQLKANHLKLLIQLCQNMINKKIINWSTPISIDGSTTGRDILYTIGDNIYSWLTIDYTSKEHNSNEFKFLSVWNKKTGITTIPELQNKVWS